ncbi:hypothetical protein ERJ75_001696000 [Trypanosoma vivax]|nr:hypothetical protein ERJ75_001696000 [Trypanosoma vivax]
MRRGQWRARRREGRWCGHGRTEQAARHVLTRRVRRARAWGRAQQSNDDLCKAPRVASSASHSNRTATASRRATQRAHAGLTSAAPLCHAQGDGSKQLKGTATGNTQGAHARTATLIRLPLVEVALALVQRGGPAMAHAHRSAAAEHGERCSHHLLFAAAVPHPGKQQHATKWKVKFHTRHRTHPRVTAHTTQLSAQAQLAHACVSLPRKRTHTVTAAAPQATQQAPNSAATSAAASTVASSAVALRSATARCAAARHAVSSLTSRAAREATSALRHGTPPLSLHRIGSAPTRARLLPQHTQAAWLVRDLSHLRFLPPPSPTQMDGQCDGHGGAWSLSRRVISARPCRRVACASSEAI